ncbi:MULTISPECIES: DGQHR domain-containing protein [Sphingobacterium]|uniref:DGQHR domain-containing protein n=1 Tax=Sphingobacterium phlebotomi TaxID=2605433 RepID=A0A5D4H5R3_9SPHI|nr:MULTISPECIES: DGQHR domain-containing protein [Sphingobacterium]NGM67313.1 DGQHR domain-containing protein [Sphingobacterium sp. SGR-19]TYR36156.1 DGQHR domain-containing protein [Sphingobacterium phlebotomi]
MSLKYRVIEVNQPLGTFYVFKISAFDLRQLVDTEPYYLSLENNIFENDGVQRKFDEDRGKEIANFLKSTESALPNSIIIAGNTKNFEETDQWRVEKQNIGGCTDDYLIIPELKINGAVIDGQHRLFSFKHLSNDEQKKYELLCTLYLDLPNPYQAYIFATINMNQRKVNKSLAYDLYGYDLSEEESNKWSPEKLAVFLSRKLNTDEHSIFKGHILLAANNDEILSKLSDSTPIDWAISTSAMVEGILSLITTNAKRDRDTLQMVSHDHRFRSVLSAIKSSAPLRKYYIENNDLLIYTILINFFKASYNALYKEGTILFKTVGVQVQFVVLKKILHQLDTDKNISIDYFQNELIKYFFNVDKIDFTDQFFQFSGIGKTRMKNVLLINMGLMTIDEIKNKNDFHEYRRLLGYE